MLDFSFFHEYTSNHRVSNVVCSYQPRTNEKNQPEPGFTVCDLSARPATGVRD
jgi:hypothetical protein